MWAEGQAYHNLPHLPPGGGGRSAGVDPLALAPLPSYRIELRQITILVAFWERGKERKWKYKKGDGRE